MLCSYGFLPHILQPTRVTEHKSSVIDNSFSNNIQDIISGNVLLNLSDHFAQMVSVNREQIDNKKINMYQSSQARVFVMFLFKIGVTLMTMCMNPLKTSTLNLKLQ